MKVLLARAGNTAYRVRTGLSCMRMRAIVVQRDEEHERWPAHVAGGLLLLLYSLEL